MRGADAGDACEVFVGFLALDAWIGNTDRHAENWVLVSDGSESRLAQHRWGGRWLDRLAAVDEGDVQYIVGSTPELSDLRRTFICRMLEENRRRLAER